VNTNPDFQLKQKEALTGFRQVGQEDSEAEHQHRLVLPHLPQRCKRVYLLQRQRPAGQMVLNFYDVSLTLGQSKLGCFAPGMYLQSSLTSVGRKGSLR